MNRYSYIDGYEKPWIDYPIWIGDKVFASLHFGEEPTAPGKVIEEVEKHEVDGSSIFRIEWADGRISRWNVQFLRKW